MNASAGRMEAIKVVYNGEVHRIRVNMGAFTMSDLTTLFRECYGLETGHYTIQYKDAEGDIVNVASNEELHEACVVQLSSGDGSMKAIRFEAVPRPQTQLQTTVAEPIVVALERLVDSLTGVVERAKDEPWKQYAEAGLSQAQRAASDVRNSFNSARQSFNEIPLDQVFKDAAEHLRSVADSFNGFAQDIVEDVRKNYNAVPAAETAAETTEPSEKATVSSSDSFGASKESEWEDVSVQNTVTEEPEIVEMSEEEKKWAIELAMIRDILPGVEKMRCIECLEQSNGNIEVVVNSLME